MDLLEAGLDTMGFILHGQRAPLALLDVPGVSHDPLLDQIMDYLASLRRVLADPAALLEREPQVRRVPASGRISRRTFARLAARSEDWERLLPEGPHPHRLRLERLREHFDLHENRIFVDALVNLERLVRKRSALVGQATDAHEEARGLADTTHVARVRISGALMGGEGDLGGSLERLARELRHAADRLRRLRGLIASAKYAEPATSLGWRRFTEPIMQTNLFRSDTRYADVAAAARILRNDGSNRDAAREAILQRSRNRQADFDEYAQELAHRSIQATRILREEALLEIANDGTLVVDWREHSVRVVPLSYPADAMAPVLSKLPDALDRTIVVAAGRPATHTLHRQGRLSLVRLSPFAVFSIERLMSALRWHLEAQALLAYPLSIRVSPRLGDAIREIAVPGCDAPIASGKLLVRSWNMEPELTRTLLLAAVDRRRDQGVHGWDDTQIAGVLNALQRTWEWRCCPICGQAASRYGWKDEPSSQIFRAKCPAASCGARWRLRRCNDHRVPELTPCQDGDPGGDQWASLDPCPICARPTS